MRLNNKGFAISTIMYMVLVLAVLVIALTLTILNGRKLIIDKQKKIATSNIYGVLGSGYSNFGGTKVAAGVNDTHKGIVYLDPTNLSATCNAQLAAANLNNGSTPTPTGITSGCMKFYIYDDSGSTYKMILDHNTSGNVAWNSTGDDTEMREVATQLLSDTAGWKGNPRLITANEVASIDGIDSSEFDVTDFSSYLTFEDYPWLYDYTYECEQYGCNIEDDELYAIGNNSTTAIYGYWTSTGAVGGGSAWVVYYYALDASSSFVGTDDSFGVRPVITLPKSVIDN